MTSEPQQFASDNYSGICPEAWTAMAEANHGHAPAYGDDLWTAKACGRLSRAVRDRLRGVLRLQRHGGQFAGAGLAVPVVSQRDLPGCGARRDRRMRRAGVLLQRFEAAGGAERRRQAHAGGDRRRSRPPQRYPFPEAAGGHDDAADRDGQVYDLDELRAISAMCRELGLSLHMDGARFANAGASLRLQPGRPDLARRRRRALLRRHQERHGRRRSHRVLQPRAGGRLRLSPASRPANSPRRCAFCRRPGSACWRPGRGCATPSMATPAPCVSGSRSPALPGLEIMFPVQANAVFVRMVDERMAALRDRGWRFYTFIGGGGPLHVRLGRRTAARRSAGCRSVRDRIGPGVMTSNRWSLAAHASRRARRSHLSMRLLCFSR